LSLTIISNEEALALQIRAENIESKKQYRIIESDGDYKHAHYIECRNLEKVSPFTVKIDDSSVVNFMSEVISIEEC